MQDDGGGREQLAHGPRDAEPGAVEERELAVGMEEADEDVGHPLHTLARPHRNVVVGRQEKGEDLEVVGEQERMHDRIPAPVAAILVDLLAELPPEKGRALLEPAARLHAVEEPSRHEERPTGVNEVMIGRMARDRGREGGDLRVEALEQRGPFRRVGSKLRPEERVEIEEVRNES